MQTDSVLVASDFLLSDVSHHAKLLYMILLSKTTKHGTTASMREMARLSGMCINTIRKAVSELVNVKVISKYPHIAGEQGVYELTTSHKKACKVAVPLFILHNRAIQPMQKVLYAILCVYKHIGKNDSCYPSYTTLGHALGVCKRTVQRAVNGLRSLGSIQTKLIRAADRFPYLQYFFASFKDFGDNKDIETTKEESAYRKLMCHIRQDEQEKEVVDKKKVCEGTSDSCTDKNKVNILSDNQYISDTLICQENFTDLDLSESEIENNLKIQIGYDSILSEYPTMRNDVDACIRCLTRTLQTTKHHTTTIRGIKYTYAELRKKISQLDRDNILLAISRYQRQSQSTLIRHPAAYMVAIIIGTIDDIDLHFENLVQYDFYNT